MKTVFDLVDELRGLRGMARAESYEIGDAVETDLFGDPKRHIRGVISEIKGENAVVRTDKKMFGSEQFILPVGRLQRMSLMEALARVDTMPAVQIITAA